MELGLIHVAGGLVVATLVVLGGAVGTGRINVRDLKGLLSLDLSTDTGPEAAADEAKKKIHRLDASGQDLRRLIARELDHLATTTYHEGKKEGRMNAENEDKHFKVSMIAMLAAVGVLLFQVIQYFGVV